MNMFDFGMGIVVGVLIMPFLTLIDIAGKILVNAIRATNSCTGDCKQGRLQCNCEDKNGN